MPRESKVSSRKNYWLRSIPRPTACSSPRATPDRSIPHARSLDFAPWQFSGNTELVKWCLVLVIFGSVFSAAAAPVPCRLKLKDGTLLEGKVTIDPKSGLVLTNGTGGQTNISLSAINSARFNADAAAAASTVSSTSNGPMHSSWTYMYNGAVA